MKDTFKFKRVIEKFLSFAYFCYFELLPKTFLLFWGYSHLTDVIFPYSEFLEEQEAKLSFYNTMTAEASSCLEASAYWWLFMPFCGSAKILQIFSSSSKTTLNSYQSLISLFGVSFWCFWTFAGWRLSNTVEDYWRLPKTNKDYQRLSKTIVDYCRLL